MFKSQIFVRNWSIQCASDQHASWKAAVRDANAVYVADAIGSDKSLSRMEDVPDPSPVGTCSSRSNCGYQICFPLISSEALTSVLAVVGELNSEESIMAYIEKEGVRSRDLNFWDIPIEAIRRVFGNDKCEEYITRAFSKSKRNERGYQNRLFLEFYILKLQILKCDSTDQLSSVPLNIEPMRDAYLGLSELELRTGRSAMDFLQDKLLPLVIREVPFYFIYQVATQGFDYTPNGDDQAALWARNTEYAWLRKENAAHVWSDSVVLKSIARPKEPVVVSDSICSVYEAPWEAPWVQRDAGNKAQRAPRRSVNATARVVKLEGLKQGYVKTGNSNDTQSASTALCLFPEEEEVFEIRKRDWETPMMMQDILDDLTSPVPESPVTAVKKRRMDHSSPETISKKLMELNISNFPKSPKTIQKIDRILSDELLSERARRAKRDSWDEYDKLNMI